MLCCPYKSQIRVQNKNLRVQFMGIQGRVWSCCEYCYFRALSHVEWLSNFPSTSGASPFTGSMRDLLEGSIRGSSKGFYHSTISRGLLVQAGVGFPFSVQIHPCKNTSTHSGCWSYLRSRS